MVKPLQSAAYILQGTVLGLCRSPKQGQSTENLWMLLNDMLLKGQMHFHTPLEAARKSRTSLFQYSTPGNHHHKHWLTISHNWYIAWKTVYSITHITTVSYHKTCTNAHLWPCPPYWSWFLALPGQSVIEWRQTLVLGRRCRGVAAGLRFARPCWQGPAWWTMWDCSLKLKACSSSDVVQGMSRFIPT